MSLRIGTDFLFYLETDPWTQNTTTFPRKLGGCTLKLTTSKQPEKRMRGSLETLTPSHFLLEAPRCKLSPQPTCVHSQTTENRSFTILLSGILWSHRD